MGPTGVVEPPPALDHDAGLGEGVEYLAIEKLVTEAGVEAFDVAILPRAPRLDVGGPGSNGGDPVLNRLRNELRAIIGSYVLRHAPEDEEVGQDVDDVGRLELPADPDRKALPRELIHHVQHAILPSIMGAILHEVIGPDVVGPFRTKSDAGSVARPDPAPLRLPAWDLQALLPPDPLHPLVVDHPARRAAQEGSHLPVA